MQTTFSFPPTGKLYKLIKKARFYSKKNKSSVSQVISKDEVVMLTDIDEKDRIYLGDEKTVYFKFTYLIGLEVCYHYISLELFKTMFKLLEE